MMIPMRPTKAILCLFLPFISFMASFAQEQEPKIKLKAQSKNQLSFELLNRGAAFYGKGNPQQIDNFLLWIADASQTTGENAPLRNLLNLYQLFGAEAPTLNMPENCDNVNAATFWGKDPGYNQVMQQLITEIKLDGVKKLLPVFSNAPDGSFPAYLFDGTYDSHRDDWLADPHFIAAVIPLDPKTNHPDIDFHEWENQTKGLFHPEVLANIPSDGMPLDGSTFYNLYDLPLAPWFEASETSWKPNTTRNMSMDTAFTAQYTNYALGTYLQYLNDLQVPYRDSSGWRSTDLLAIGKQYREILLGLPRPTPGIDAQTPSLKNKTLKHMIATSAVLPDSGSEFSGETTPIKTTHRGEEIISTISIIDPSNLTNFISGQTHWHEFTHATIDTLLLPNSSIKRGNFKKYNQETGVLEVTYGGLSRHTLQTDTNTHFYDQNESRKTGFEHLTNPARFEENDQIVIVLTGDEKASRVIRCNNGQEKVWTILDKLENSIEEFNAELTSYFIQPFLEKKIASAQSADPRPNPKFPWAMRKRTANTFNQHDLGFVEEATGAINNFLTGRQVSCRNLMPSPSRLIKVDFQTGETISGYRSFEDFSKLDTINGPFRMGISSHEIGYRQIGVFQTAILRQLYTAQSQQPMTETQYQDLVEKVNRLYLATLFEYGVAVQYPSHAYQYDTAYGPVNVMDGTTALTPFWEGPPTFWRIFKRIYEDLVEKDNPLAFPDSFKNALAFAFAAQEMPLELVPFSLEDAFEGYVAEKNLAPKTGPNWEVAADFNENGELDEVDVHIHFLGLLQGKRSTQDGQTDSDPYLYGWRKSEPLHTPTTITFGNGRELRITPNAILIHEEQDETTNSHGDTQTFVLSLNLDRFLGLQDTEIALQIPFKENIDGEGLSLVGAEDGKLRFPLDKFLPQLTEPILLGFDQDGNFTHGSEVDPEMVFLQLAFQEGAIPALVVETPSPEWFSGETFTLEQLLNENPIPGLKERIYLDLGDLKATMFLDPLLEQFAGDSKFYEFMAQWGLAALKAEFNLNGPHIQFDGHIRLCDGRTLQEALADLKNHFQDWSRSEESQCIADFTFYLDQDALNEQLDDLLVLEVPLTGESGRPPELPILGDRITFGAEAFFLDLSEAFDSLSGFAVNAWQAENGQTFSQLLENGLAFSTGFQNPTLLVHLEEFGFADLGEGQGSAPCPDDPEQVCSESDVDPEDAAGFAASLSQERLNNYITEDGDLDILAIIADQQDASGLPLVNDENDRFELRILLSKSESWEAELDPVYQHSAGSSAPKSGLIEKYLKRLPASLLDREINLAEHITRIAEDALIGLLPADMVQVKGLHIVGLPELAVCGFNHILVEGEETSVLESCAGGEENLGIGVTIDEIRLDFDPKADWIGQTTAFATDISFLFNLNESGDGLDSEMSFGCLGIDLPPITIPNMLTIDGFGSIERVEEDGTISYFINASGNIQLDKVEAAIAVAFTMVRGKNSDGESFMSIVNIGAGSEFPQMIPLGSSGLGLKGIGGSFTFPLGGALGEGFVPSCPANDSGLTLFESQIDLKSCLVEAEQRGTITLDGCTKDIEVADPAFVDIGVLDKYYRIELVAMVSDYPAGTLFDGVLKLESYVESDTDGSPNWSFGGSIELSPTQIMSGAAGLEVAGGAKICVGNINEGQNLEAFFNGALDVSLYKTSGEEEGETDFDALRAQFQSLTSFSLPAQGPPHGYLHLTGRILPGAFLDNANLSYKLGPLNMTSKNIKIPGNEQCISATAILGYNSDYDKGPDKPAYGITLEAQTQLNLFGLITLPLNGDMWFALPPSDPTVTKFEAHVSRHKEEPEPETGPPEAPTHWDGYLAGYSREITFPHNFALENNENTILREFYFGADLLLPPESSSLPNVPDFFGETPRPRDEHEAPYLRPLPLPTGKIIITILSQDPDPKIDLRVGKEPGFGQRLLASHIVDEGGGTQIVTVDKALNPQTQDYQSLGDHEDVWLPRHYLPTAGSGPYFLTIIGLEHVDPTQDHIHMSIRTQKSAEFHGENSQYNWVKTEQDPKKYYGSNSPTAHGLLVSFGGDEATTQNPLEFVDVGLDLHHDVEFNEYLGETTENGKTVYLFNPGNTDTVYIDIPFPIFQQNIGSTGPITFLGSGLENLETGEIFIDDPTTYKVPEHEDIGLFYGDHEVTLDYSQSPYCGPANINGDHCGVELRPYYWFDIYSTPSGLYRPFVQYRYGGKIYQLTNDALPYIRIIDNNPPPAPSQVGSQLSGDQVQVTWQYPLGLIEDYCPPDHCPYEYPEVGSFRVRLYKDDVLVREVPLDLNQILIAHNPENNNQWADLAAAISYNGEDQIGISALDYSGNVGYEVFADISRNKTTYDMPIPDIRIYYEGGSSPEEVRYKVEVRNITDYQEPFTLLVRGGRLEHRQNGGFRVLGKRDRQRGFSRIEIDPDLGNHRYELPFVGYRDIRFHFRAIAFDPSRLALSSLSEMRTVTLASADEDGDDYPDVWRNLYYPHLTDLTKDHDNDGFPSEYEIFWSTDPLVADTDGDGIPDGSDPDPLNGSPLNQDVFDFFQITREDLARDQDNDGLTGLDEIKLGTDPRNNDSDGDGFLDGIEIRYGSDPTAYNLALGRRAAKIIRGSWQKNGDTYEVDTHSGAHGLLLFPEPLDRGLVYSDIASPDVGRYENGFICFDYDNADNFYFAGVYIAQNKVVVGRMENGVRTTLDYYETNLLPNTQIPITLYFDGDSQIQVGYSGIPVLTFDRERNGPLTVGLLNVNGKTRFHNTAVYQTGLFNQPVAGSWHFENRTVGQSEPNGKAILLSQRVFNYGTLSTSFASEDIGRWENAFFIFNYKDENNFHFAGMYEGSNLWTISVMENGVRSNLAQVSDEIVSGLPYAVQLSIAPDNLVTLRVDGETKVSHIVEDLKPSRVGLFTINGKALFTSLSWDEIQEPFPYRGTWQRGDDYTITGSTGDKAILLAPRSFRQGQMRARFNTDPNGDWKNGFFIFDFVDENNFKYAGAWEGRDEWVIGEMVNNQRRDLVLTPGTIPTGQYFDMALDIHPSGYVVLHGNNEKVAEWKFDALNSQVGLFNMRGNTSYQYFFID